MSSILYTRIPYSLIIMFDVYVCVCVVHTYGRRQNKLCVPFRLNAALYFLPTEKRTETEQNKTCEKTDGTKSVDFNVFY